MPKTINIEVLPKQYEFLTAMEREVLYSGAFGSGKSRAVCLKTAMRAAVKGAREGLCRKHLVTFKATTLKTLLEPDGILPPVLPEGSYLHNKGDKTIRIHGGGEIQYFGLDDEKKIGSYNLTGCGIDEAVELIDRDWIQLRGRIRVEVPGLPNQIYGACNPGPPGHFLAARFGLAEGFKARPNCKAITTRSIDNTYLPQSYLDDLATFTGLAKLRFVDGVWAGSDGLVYDKWERSKFVMDRPGPWVRVLVGQDEGYTNPACLLVCGEDGDGRIHVISEWYKTKQLEAQVVDYAKSVAQDHDIEAFIIDPSAAKIRAAMAQADLPVVEANNDVFGGIQAVQQRLVLAGDGQPRLTVSPQCENLIREFETYEWLPSKDKPKKENDHALDALRYLVMHADQQHGLVYSFAGGPEKTTQPFDQDRYFGGDDAD